MARIELVFPNFTFSRMNRNDYENVDLLEPKCRKIHYISSFFVRPHHVPCDSCARASAGEKWT